MRPPFPGMDPWLEHPSLWMGVHNRLIAALCDELIEALPEDYFVDIEERLYVAQGEEDGYLGRGDVTISGRAPARGNGGAKEKPVEAGALLVDVVVADWVRETFLKVHKPRERRIVTVVEMLSPSNKRAGEGRNRYLDKRASVLGSGTNLVEIDLTRGGERMPLRSQVPASDYSIFVSRRVRRPRAELLPFGVKDPIPTFHLPLDPGEKEPVVRLGETLRALYTRARYHRVIDYRRPPVPPLRASDRAWAKRRVRDAGSRG